MKEKQKEAGNEDRNDDNEVSRVIVPVVIFGAFDLVRYTSVHLTAYEKMTYIRPIYFISLLNIYYITFLLFSSFPPTVLSFSLPYFPLQFSLPLYFHRYLLFLLSIFLSFSVHQSLSSLIFINSYPIDSFPLHYFIPSPQASSSSLSHIFYT